MTLPIDLVLIRHGESEGNAAKRLAEAGDETLISELSKRHTSTFRLSERGRDQAVLAGEWLRKEFSGEKRFDKYYVSEYFRAMETAALLGFQDAKWLCDTYLRERSWGEIETSLEKERLKKYSESLKMRKKEPFFWEPPNGESFAELCLRIDRFIDTLRRECGDKRVVVGCHGETILGIRIKLEGISPWRFRELYFSKDNRDIIYNCQIIHYSRKNPKTEEITPYLNWVRMIRPTTKPVERMAWQEIQRPRYSNEDLLKIVNTVSPVIE